MKMVFGEHKNESRKISVEDGKYLFRQRRYSVRRFNALYEFILLVSRNMKETYLEEITSTEDMLGHFNWCYSKALNEFNNKHYTIEDYSEFKHYLFEIFDIIFYSNNAEKFDAECPIIRDLIDMGMEKIDIDYDDLDMLNECSIKMLKQKNKRNKNG